MENERKTTNAYRIFLRRFLAGALLLLLLCALTVLVFDPFYHYHAPSFGLRPVLTEKEHQVDGTLRTFDYDGILLGSSHADNFDLSQAEALFGFPFVKAVRSGGNLFDLCAYADEAFEAQPALKLVLFNLDPAPLHGTAEESFAETGYPFYLQDKNPFNDVSYLLNKDVLLRRIPYELAQSASARFVAERPYSWYAEKDFSEAATLSHYPRHPRTEPMGDKEAGSENFEANCARLLALIEAHPATDFVFFLPPLSMLYWDSVYRAGTLEQVLYECEQVLARVLSYDNVSAYFFCDDRALITDLDRYMDFTHYDEKANDRILEELADPDSAFRLRSVEDVSARMQGMRSLVEDLLANEIKALEDAGRFHYSDG
ncbi:MAG: SGNH/GDSL hydrolase family protein [Lachnospiraceae bacterium]|nr:SGNH/GDSL hydrolase family protein [Lachnospiraceae bacterium]